MLTPHTIHVDLVNPQGPSLIVVLGATSDDDQLRTARVEVTVTLGDDPLMTEAVSQLSKLVASDTLTTLQGVHNV